MACRARNGWHGAFSASSRHVRFLGWFGLPRLLRRVGTTAAEVNGEEIPATEATQAWSDTQARWSRQFGTDIPHEQRVAMQANILEGWCCAS